MRWDFTNYDDLKNEVEMTGVNFFNEALSENYDYCILFGNLLPLYTFVKAKVINRYNIPIYTPIRIETDFSGKLENKNVLLLVHSVSTLSDCEKVQSFIDILECKMNPINITVMIMMVAEEISDKLSFETHHSHDKKNLLKKTVPATTKKVTINLNQYPFRPSNHDLIIDNNINHIFKSLDNPELSSPLLFLFFSIFESDFMLDEDKETIIFTDVTLYFILLHFIETGKISNKKKKNVMVCFELEEESNKKIIQESTVITIVSYDNKTHSIEAVEDIKHKIFNINPKLTESDIYQEDLIHF